MDNIDIVLFGFVFLFVILPTIAIIRIALEELVLSIFRKGDDKDGDLHR